MPGALMSPATALRICIATRDAALLPGVQESLASVFHITLVNTCAEFLSLLEETPFEAVIIDLDTAGESSEEVIGRLKELRQVNGDMVMLAFTRSYNKRIRRRAEQAGVEDFLVSPFNFADLRELLQHHLELRHREIEDRALRDQVLTRCSFCGLIGRSEPMRRLYDAISRVAQGSTTVLLRGESGTGKELVAQAIVACSPRRDKPLVSVNCSALPETLIESELFGHEKGAYTGAHESRPGQIELAHGGTLFLDEIGNLGLEMQSKLLRTLEQHTVQRIGSKVPKRIDFRLITATNEDLEAAVHSGRFREDLYYRINVVPIILPPLREREADIPLLIDHFLSFYCRANNLPLKRLDADVLEILEDYHWPGNVRELENVVQRLVLMVPSDVIHARHLPQHILCNSTAKNEALLIPENGIVFDEEMASIEVAYLQAALRRTHGKKRAAADLLHIEPRRMKYLCHKYHVRG